MAEDARNYEAMMMLNAQLGDEETQNLITRYEEILKNGGATIKETARWGRRRLAYEINRRRDAYYVIFYFTVEGPARELLDQFERASRYDENVMRHMVIKVPVKKRGREVAQLVPQAGYLADFRFEPRGMRRRYEERTERPAPGQRPAGPAAPAAAEAPKPVAPEAENVETAPEGGESAE